MLGIQSKPGTLLSRTKAALLVLAILGLCCTLVGCGQGNKQEDTNASKNNASEEKGSEGLNGSQQETSSKAQDSTPAPTTKSAYLQKTAIGDNNMVAFIITEQEGRILSMKVIMGNVKVSGNITTKKNYSTSTATVENPDPQAFKASYNSAAGSVTGSIAGGVLTATLTNNLGEFSINAHKVETRICTSCSGSGTKTTGSSGFGTSGGSSVCTTCNGAGLEMAYDGTYI